MQTQSLPEVVANLHLWTDTERERERLYDAIHQANSN